MAIRDLPQWTAYALVLLVSAALPACADLDNKRVADAMSTELDGDCPQDITYEKVARPFVARYCLRCHSEKSTTNAALAVAHVFDTEADVRGAGQHLYDTVAMETMPPSFGPADLLRPTTHERNALLSWLECSGVAEELHQDE